ncbi:PREDICTED: uncharacterized protein LOC106741701 isoform X1 [Dinoponera quadriceps]|uniref:Uncharacterized protein LOC106741701 isoform X1 n=1 Tax=Dinoponera quadriceps TaxID=609295 RepID=A0A6P3WTH0_DINQU|nr:PREDICTED: uncharacterized protein LOC106741701 isoform X1 [Dinoponera quadriceps]
MELNGVGAPIVGAVACPVCTLYLREGISLQKHLDTHPKEQVIDALIKASSSSLQPQQQVQQQQQQQQQQQNASTASAPALVSLPQATPQGSATIQTPQASSQVSQNAHIPAHSPYPIGPIFECPPISTMMPPQFTSFSYQQFVNNGTMMIPQAYAMAPQTNQMMQMLYSPYGMYQQQQIPTVQMISPVTAIPGATRIRPVATMAAENRATVAVPMSSPEPKQILPEILPEPESGQVLSNLPASPLLQSENTTTVRSSREEADGNNALQMDHRMQRTPSSTPPGESIVQHEYNSIPRSIAITCTINSSGVNDKVEMVLPDIQDEEEPLDVGPADLQCASVAYEQPEDAQQFVQQVAEEEGYASDKEIDMSSDAIDPVACETEAVCDERPTSCGATDDDDTPREASVNDAKEPVQPEVESQLENLLITIIETEFSGTSSQKEAQDVHQGERLDEKEKVMADRVESVIHDTVMTTLGCHENDHILPDMQENDAECPNDYVDNELEKTYQHRHVRSAPPSPFAKKEPVFREDAVGSSRHGAYFERPRVGSCDNLILYLRDDDEKVEDAEDNFDEADMEIEEIPSPHTPFARYSNGSAECVRSHTPLSAISGISVLRVRTDLSKPCSPASVHSFCHVDSDSLSHDEDSNSGIDNNVIEKDPIDCSQVEEKIKTDHQQQAMSTVCESTDKVQESGYVYHHHHHHHHHHHQSVITEHVSSFSVNHSQQPQQPVLTHESYSMTSSKTHSLLNLSESINPTTSTESKSFHTTAKSLMPKQPMELLNINEDAHAGPMNVFEFEGLQIIVPSTFISDSSQKAVSATSQQSMASSEGAVGIDEEVKSINMRADETMPPRGELSEQESNGCTEQSAWQLYMGQESSRMSTSYDLLARESWEESEGSDNEISGPLLDSRSLATHFTSSLFLDRDRKTPTKRTFKCYHCSEVFDCPKERRVHSTTVHKGAVPSSSRDQLDQPEVKDIKLLDNRMNVFDDIFVPGLHVQQMYHQQQPLLHQLQPPQPSDLGKAENGDQKIDSLAIPSAIEVTCAICNQRFNSEKSLQVHHKRMHIAEVNKRIRENAKCQICSEEFPTVFLFNAHLKIHPLECGQCGKYFYRKQNFKLHMKRHLGIKPFPCTVCDKAFLTKQKLDEHTNGHTGNAPVKCSLCNETFRRYSNLTQHKNRHHLNIKKKLKDYICHCGEVFHTKKKLAWHKETHDEKPKACTYCNERFIHMASLTRHMRRAHNRRFVPDAHRESENVECPICKCIYLRSSLAVHMRVHNGERPYECQVCSKAFSTKWNLQLHKWTHAARSTKPFKCNQCSAAFYRHSDYTAHMNSHRNVRPYTCNYCGAQFIRKYNCLRHVKEHEENKAYTCDVCNKTFHRSYYLKEHLRVHSGARPYTCHICGKTSGTKSNHNKHVRIHHAREPVNTEN